MLPAPAAFRTSPVTPAPSLPRPLLPRSPPPAPPNGFKRSTFGVILFGTILLLVGGVLLIDYLNLVPVILVDNLWPLVLIGTGAAYLGSVLYNRR
jgi:hypothetical protein